MSRSKDLQQNSLHNETGNFFGGIGKRKDGIGNKRPFLARLFRRSPDAISHRNFAGEEDEMADEFLSRARFGEVLASAPRGMASE